MAWPTDRDRSNFFVVITGCNDNDNMMLVVDLVVQCGQIGRIYPTKVGYPTFFAKMVGF